MKRLRKTFLALVFAGVFSGGITGYSTMGARATAGGGAGVSVRKKIDGVSLDAAGRNSPYEKPFQKIWLMVQQRFHDAKLNGVDWNKVGSLYHARLSGVKTRAEFAALMNQMLDELHASHTAFVTDDDAEFYMLNSVSAQDLEKNQVEHIGVMGHREGKEYVVNAVLDGGPAEKAGILAGDRLLFADGQPFTTAASFRGKEGMAVQVEFRREGEAKTRTVSVVPIKKNMLRSYLDATIKSARVLEVEGRKIGYIHLWTMAQETFRTTLEHLAMTKLHDTDGLILDLRDGYGGQPFGYSDVFFRPDVSWEASSHSGRDALTHTGYAKPMVVLINEGTRSAKEFFTYQLKTAHRARIVGTTTAGAFLGAGFVKIGEDGLLELAEVGLKVDGKALEKSGVTPDIVVAPKYPYTERDTQFAQARQTLLRMIPEQGQETKKPGVIHVH